MFEWSPILSELNNREIATAFWLLIVFFWALSISEVRKSLRELAIVFFSAKIFIRMLVMFVYIYIIVLFLEKIGFWDITASKDTILWIFGTAVTTFIHLKKSIQDDNFFTKFVADNMKLILILEFVINIYAFPLPVEFFLIPIIASAAVVKGTVNVKQEYKIIEPFLNGVLAIAGISIFFFTLREIINDFTGFATMKNLRDFLLPMIFSVAFLPYVYVMALYMLYESLFLRISLAKNDKHLEHYAKMKILVDCNINLLKLKNISKKAGYPKVQSKEEILAWFSL